MKMKTAPVVAALTFGVFLFPGASGFGESPHSDMDLVTLRDTFEDRRDKAFAAYRGKELEIEEKRKPLGRGRPLYSRHFTYSILEFAITAFWNNEQLDAANEALMENANHYIGSRAARNDRDSFYWGADVLARTLELFGRDGSRAPGRLDPGVEDRMLEMMWLFAKENSYVGEAKWWDPPPPAVTQPLSADTAEYGTWRIIQSENHTLQKFTALWHFSGFLKDSPKYRDRTYDDGHVAAEHYEAWTEYAKEFFRERARKGLFVEMANGWYGAHSLKGIYNLYDFAEDPQLRKLAKNFLDLYYATWAQEQIDGVRGGGKSRIYPQWYRDGKSQVREFMWFYLGIGEQPDLHAERATVATSEYRMPLVVMDIALDIEGRGEYEVRNRVHGLAPQGYEYIYADHRLRQDFGGRVRYAYATSDFIMGMPMLDARPLEDWTRIAVLRQRMGVIFRGGVDDRIMPVHDAAFNAQWGVQRKGTMIIQRLPKPYANSSDNMRVWLGGDGLGNGVERDGWLFVAAKGAYAAVRPARGEYRLKAGVNSLSNSWMDIEDNSSPVILEVAGKERFDGYEAFQDAVLALPMEWEDSILHYGGLYGNKFVFHADHDHIAEVDGKPIDLAPDKVFNSPFVQSEWNSGVVAIAKGDRQRVLEFD